MKIWRGEESQNSLFRRNEWNASFVRPVQLKIGVFFFLLANKTRLSLKVDHQNWFIKSGNDKQETNEKTKLQQTRTRTPHRLCCAPSSPKRGGNNDSLLISMYCGPPHTASSYSQPQKEGLEIHCHAKDLQAGYKTVVTGLHFLRGRNWGGEFIHLKPCKRVNGRVCVFRTKH